MKNLLRGQFRWVLVVWMFLIAAVAFLDRVNISISGRFIEQELNLSHIQLGWVFSAFVLGYALFQVPGGRMAELSGPAKVLAVVVLWHGRFTSAKAWTPSGVSFALGHLLCVRFLLGSGEACMFPSSNRMIASWIAAQERGLADGIIFAGVGAGAATALPLIGYNSAYGWYWAFWITRDHRSPRGFRLAPDRHKQTRGSLPGNAQGSMLYSRRHGQTSRPWFEGRAMERHSTEQGRAGGQRQLFLLWLRKLRGR